LPMHPTPSCSRSGHRTIKARDNPPSWRLQIVPV
jgi:hypothetical protein